MGYKSYPLPAVHFMGLHSGSLPLIRRPTKGNVAFKKTITRIREFNPFYSVFNDGTGFDNVLHFFICVRYLCINSFWSLHCLFFSSIGAWRNSWVPINQPLSNPYLKKILYFQGFPV